MVVAFIVMSGPPNPNCPNGLEIKHNCKLAIFCCEYTVCKVYYYKYRVVTSLGQNEATSDCPHE